MRIPLVIPVFNRDDVFATITSLRGTDYAGDLHFIVIDNGNVAGLSAKLAALAGPDCEVIRFAKNRGGSAAYIAGMKRAMELDGDYVWLLDDDAKPNAETLPELVKAMDSLLEKGVKAASVGSGVECDGRLIECGTRFSVLLGHASPYVREGLNEVDYSAACSLLVNKAAVRECGFWEDVFIHFDDIEWGIRVKRTGWRNFATSASRVDHPKFDPKKAGPWIAYFDARNQYWFAAKFGPLHVALAWGKNKLKDMGGDPMSNRYRALAWADYKAGIRRDRDGAVAAVEGTGR